ncbi:MAG: GDYXXLXY domain-containing protein, partial [Thermoguttaceae bacterium]|nr:GDYXXLXY domain-containing protein [Thermoguttaceae bacterium]
QTKPLHIFTAIIFAVWLTSDSVPLFEARNEVSLLPFTAAVVATLGYRLGRVRGSKFVAGLYLVLLAYWALLQTPFWKNAIQAALELIFAGGLFWYFGERVVANRAVGRLSQVLGALFTFLSLNALAFETDWNLPASRADANFNVVFAIYCVLALAAAALVYKRRGARGIPFPKSGVLAKSIFDELCKPSGIAILMIPVNFLVVNANGCDLLVISTYVNALMLVGTWRLIISGASRSTLQYWGGVTFFIIWALCRYLDWFRLSQNALSAAMFFAILAVGLFLFAFFFHRIRRKAEAAAEARERQSVAEEEARLIEDAAIRREPNAFAHSIGLWLVVAAQFTAAFAVVGRQATLFAGPETQTIVVESRPIDPYDPFRGEYVALSYPFSRALPKDSDFEIQVAFDGVRAKTVYTLLRLDENDGVYRAFKITDARPAPEELGENEIYIVGRGRDSFKIRYGIEKYFVEQGSARKIEDAARNGSGQKILVELKVAPNGAALISDVQIVPNPPQTPDAPTVETVESSEETADSVVDGQ